MARMSLIYSHANELKPRRVQRQGKSWMALAWRQNWNFAATYYSIFREIPKIKCIDKSLNFIEVKAISKVSA
jgi:hypothetical protein